MRKILIICVIASFTLSGALFVRAMMQMDAQFAMEDRV